MNAISDVTRDNDEMDLVKVEVTHKSSLSRTKGE